MRRRVLARPRRVARPRRPSHEELKAEFFLWLKSVRSGWVAEYHFHPTRNWRFDFAHLELRMAVEVEGVSTAISRHQTIPGYRKDCIKYNEASLLGWRLFRFTYEMLRMDRTYTLMDQAMKR